jgi:hypothetical protein
MAEIVIEQYNRGMTVSVGGGYKGSEWRKWDLHVHTPYSIVQYFSGGVDKDEVWEKYIQDIENLPKEFSVLGINDYLFIDGYKRLKKEKEENGRLKNIDSLMPVVEFRLAKFGGTSSALRRVNFHVIFSPEVDPDVIDQHFLRALPSSYILSPSFQELQKKWAGLATRDSLVDLGKLIKSSVPKKELGNFGSDLIEGFNNLNFDEVGIREVLEKSTYFKDKYITAVGKTEWASVKWTSQSIADKKNIINSCDLVFISVNGQSEYDVARQSLKDAGVNSKLFDCSDAHHPSTTSKEKDRLGNSFTWIKGDLTFDALKHALVEFEDRVYVGGNHLC